MFYDLFCELCKKKGVSPTKATVEIGLSRTIGTKWKTTGATPQGDTLSKIAAYFDVSVDYLLGNEQEKKPVTNKDDELIKAINERPLLKRFVENLVKMDDESITAFVTIAGIKDDLEEK